MGIGHEDKVSQVGINFLVTSSSESLDRIWEILLQKGGSVNFMSTPDSQIVVATFDNVNLYNFPFTGILKELTGVLNLNSHWQQL